MDLEHRPRTCTIDREIKSHSLRQQAVATPEAASRRPQTAGGERMVFQKTMPGVLGRAELSYSSCSPPRPVHSTLLLILLLTMTLPPHHFPRLLRLPLLHSYEGAAPPCLPLKTSELHRSGEHGTKLVPHSPPLLTPHSSCPSASSSTASPALAPARSSWAGPGPPGPAGLAAGLALRAPGLSRSAASAH
jgi:hypothetical protein